MQVYQDDTFPFSQLGGSVFGSMMIPFLSHNWAEVFLVQCQLCACVKTILTFYLFFCLQ